MGFCVTALLNRGRIANALKSLGEEMKRLSALVGHVSIRLDIGRYLSDAKLVNALAINRAHEI